MKIELNITMKCNMGCPQCNRMCNVYREREEHMSLEQINKFIEQISHVPGTKRVKVVGGEPLMHPNFAEIHNLLVDAVEKKFISYVKIGTNKTITRPTNLKEHPAVRFGGKLSRKKSHIPYLWSPLDLGFKTDGDIEKLKRCMQLRRCGFSLDKYGYLPCSMAIMIARLLGYTDLYKYEIPTEVWGLDVLCKHCTLSMDSQWIKAHTKPLKLITPEDQTPTKTFQEGLDKFDLERFHKEQKEF